MNAHQDQWKIVQRNRRPHKAKESGDGMPKQDHKGSHFKVLVEMEAGVTMGLIWGRCKRTEARVREGTNAIEVEEHSGKVKRVEKRARGIRNGVLSTILFNAVSKEGTGGEILREKGLASSESALVTWAPNEDGAIPMAHTEDHNLDPVCNGLKPKLIILAETKSQTDAPFHLLLAGSFNVCEFIPSDGRSGGIAILWKNNGCTVNVLEKNRQFIHMECSLSDSPPFLLMAIYALPYSNFFSVLWYYLELFFSITIPSLEFSLNPVARISGCSALRLCGYSTIPLMNF
ncbi:hypothetical protein K1719_028813 [Acacia pycnantha]|nr:hypothetical protein K1719_028813 [Acacia pycnantha]